MPKYPEEQRNVSVPPPARWVWSDETRSVEFLSSGPAEEGVLRKRRNTNVNFNDLQQRSEWLAEICTVNRRGRQSITKCLSHAHPSPAHPSPAHLSPAHLSPAHLSAYRASVMKRQRDHITIDDVKRKCHYVVELMTKMLHDLSQVAVSLLQENYSLPIPFCFLAVLKSKELDEVLTALLLYLSCFFEHKSLENTPKSLMAADVTTEYKLMTGASAKKEMAQKKLAVCYFSLIMDLRMEQHEHTSYHKGQTLSNRTEWLLHACLYSFFCFVAWVTFGRKDLRDIQEEVGRLLYSDTFNTAVRRRTDEDSEVTFADVNGSVKTGEGDPKETGRNSTLRHVKAQQRSGRMSQSRPALSSLVNQRSPLMVSLLPSPQERSPHLFLGSRVRRQSPLQAECCDTKALTEELDQQLASVSFGILGKPSSQFNHSTLTPYEEQKNN